MNVFEMMEQIEKEIESGDIQGFYQFSDLQGECTLVNLYLDSTEFPSGDKKNEIVFMLKDKKGTATYKIEIPNKNMKSTRIIILADRIRACLDGILFNVDGAKLKGAPFKDKFEAAQKRCGSTLNYELDAYNYTDNRTGKEKTIHNLISLRNIKENVGEIPKKPEKSKTSFNVQEDVPF